MSVNQERCWVIVCDDCAVTGGDEPHHDDGYTLHFTTETDALDWATDNGWTTTDTHCAADAAAPNTSAATSATSTTSGSPAPAADTLPAHATTGCPLIRACIYCGHHDLALLANLPTH